MLKPILIAGLLSLPFSLGCDAKTCEFQGAIYEEGEKFSVDCNSCTCNRSGVMCTLLACHKVCSGTLGVCELNSHKDCPAVFPREDSECAIEESAICYKCGFSELDAVAESASCESGRWKFVETACGS